MAAQWNKKILVVMMQWDYCDKSRGISGDKLWFYDNFLKLAEQVEPFWYDEYFNDLPGLQQALKEKAEKFKPDLIFFIPYTDQFTAETLDTLKQKWPTCAWFGDDSWRFDGYSSRMAPHYSYCCTTDMFSVHKYRRIGIEPILTQWAAQTYSLEPRSPLEKGAAYSYDVSFVGAYNEVRGWFIKRLAKLGVKVQCFGAGWPAGRVSFPEMERIFRDTRINLNLSNSVSRDIRYVLGGVMNLARYFISKKNVEQMKARNFEIPLAGGFELTNYVPGLEHYLTIGEETVVYSAPEDCALQIKYYMENEEYRRAIMQAGYERVKKEHTYLRRLEQILAVIWPEKNT